MINLEKTAAKYELEPVSLRQLQNKIGILLTHDNKKKVSESSSIAYEHICKAIKELEKIQRTEERIMTKHLRGSIEVLEKEKRNLDSTIASLGLLKIDGALEKRYLKNGNTKEMIEQAKYKEAYVSFREGSASIKTKNEFSLKQAYVNELFIIARYWIAHKGKIAKTRPENLKDSLNFYEFASEILGISTLTPSSIFEKFYQNYEVEYNFN